MSFPIDAGVIVMLAQVRQVIVALSCGSVG